MKIIIIISLMVTFLFAQNPRVYSAIGDEIYNNAPAINNLKSLSAYPYEEKKIEDYISDVEASKEIGFKIESGSKDVSPSAYLKKLRELAKTDASFVRKVNAMYKKALVDENSLLFIEMVNSGLLETKSKQKDIMDFYIKHQDDIDPAGVIQTFLDEDAELRRRQAYWLEAKKRKEAARVKYLRAKDKAEEKALEEKLTKEVIEKKKEIRTHQKQELNIH